MLNITTILAMISDKYPHFEIQSVQYITLTHEDRLDPHILVGTFHCIPQLALIIQALHMWARLRMKHRFVQYKNPARESPPAA